MSLVSKQMRKEQKQMTTLLPCLLKRMSASSLLKNDKYNDPTKDIITHIVNFWCKPPYGNLDVAIMGARVGRSLY